MTITIPPSSLMTRAGCWCFLISTGDRILCIYVKSENPEDIGSWGQVNRLALNDTDHYKDMWDTYTYTHPVRLSEEDGRIYLFWRGIDNKPNYASSDDDGETWTKGKIFILPERSYQNRRPYLKVFSNGKDVIHFAFTDGHPRS